MIACYVWTNLQLVNISNAKINMFPDEPADLYIRIPLYNQISVSLINAVESSRAFQKIYYIEPPTLDKQKLRFGFIPKFRTLFMKEFYLNYYKRVLNNCATDKIYNRLLIPMFIGSSDVFYCVNHWHKKNKKLKIAFVEEGAGMYARPQKELLNFPHPVKTVSSILTRFLLDNHFAKKFRSLVDSIYVYAPENCLESVTLPKIKLPSLSEENNSVMLNLIKATAVNLELSHYTHYNQRCVYFFSTYYHSRPLFELRSNLIIESILDTVKGSRVVVKVHTNSPRHAETFAKQYESVLIPDPSRLKWLSRQSDNDNQVKITQEYNTGLLVDRLNYLFEGLFSMLDDAEEKILIAYTSSTTMYPKLMFNKEPYVILIHRLYNDSSPDDIERDEKFAEGILRIYDDKSKVLIPNSLLEFQEMLGNIQSKIRKLPGGKN